VSQPLDRPYPPATSFFPPRRSLPSLRDAVQTCRACRLCVGATQAVFGEGPAKARMVLVGEQPGDQEDIQGRPFVGPAGRVLEEILAEVGVARDEVYLTNAVKHFSFERRGKWRIHKTPSIVEVNACQPWVTEELRLIRPRVLVCLGATATRALLGLTVKVLRDRGQILDSRWAHATVVTVHPSAVLRAPDENRAALRADLRSDLALAASLLERQPVEDQSVETLA